MAVLICAIDLASVAKVFVAKFNTFEGAELQLLQTTRPPQSQAEKTDDFLTISKPNLTYLSLFFFIQIWMGS